MLVKVVGRALLPRLERAHVELHRLRLLAELLAERLLHLAEIDVEQVRQHAVVDHVLDEAAELRVRADLGDDLVERHGIEHEVVREVH